MSESSNESKLDELAEAHNKAYEHLQKQLRDWEKHPDDMHLKMVGAAACEVYRCEQAFEEQAEKDAPEHAGSETAEHAKSDEDAELERLLAEEQAEKDAAMHKLEEQHVTMDGTKPA